MLRVFVQITVPMVITALFYTPDIYKIMQAEKIKKSAINSKNREVMHEDKFRNGMCYF